MAEYTGSINLSYNPTIIPKPFAYNGTRSVFGVNATGTNKASFSQGFPTITSQSLPDGGVPPARTDFNALGYDTTSWLYYFQNGGVIRYDGNVALQIGGYPKGARLWVDTTSSGTIIVKAKQQTTVNPSNVLTEILSDRDPNWAVDFIGGNKNVWSSGAFTPGSYRTIDFTVPFDIASEYTIGNDYLKYIPLDNIIINIFGCPTGNASYRDWQTIYNQCSFQDDANRRDNLGFGIFTMGRRILRFISASSYGFFGYYGGGLPWSNPQVLIRVIKV